MLGKLVQSGSFLTYTEEKLRDAGFSNNSLDIIPKAQKNQKTNKREIVLHQNRKLSASKDMKLQSTEWGKILKSYIPQ